MPSGLILSVLTDEQYVAVEGRDDESWYKTVLAIRDRLNYDLTVLHPCDGVDEELTKSRSDTCMLFLRDKLSWAIGVLAPAQSSACEKSEVLKCWKKVFDTDFFDSQIEEAEKEEKERSRRRNESAPNICRPKPYFGG